MLKLLLNIGEIICGVWIVYYSIKSFKGGRK